MKRNSKFIFSKKHVNFIEVNLTFFYLKTHALTISKRWSLEYAKRCKGYQITCTPIQDRSSVILWRPNSSLHILQP